MEASFAKRVLSREFYVSCHEILSTGVMSAESELLFQLLVGYKSGNTYLYKPPCFAGSVFLEKFKVIFYWVF